MTMADTQQDDRQTNPLILKLERGARLTADDRVLLEQISGRRRRVGPREDLILEGDKPSCVHLIIDGLACRHKILPSGRRSIMAFFVPGDFCDLDVAILGQMDHTISTLTACTVVQIPQTTIGELTTEHPRVARALRWATLVDEAVLREWLVNMGHRSADRQLAHLLCELHLRLEVVGRAGEASFELPLSQQVLGEATGLSTVHVNRTIQSLRERRLIEMSHHTVRLVDVERLREFAEFDPTYLHLRTADAR